MKDPEKQNPIADRWLADARALLDESIEGLDAASLSRLNRMRHTALARRRPGASRSWWLPGAGVAVTCALLLAVGAWYPHTRPAGPVVATAQVATPNLSETDAAAADDGIELYQDLEFYAWLDAQEQDNDG